MNRLHIQRAALHGLFTAIWESMIMSKAYNRMVLEAEATEGKVKEYRVNGRLAHWTTEIYSYSNKVHLQVMFRNSAFGLFSFRGPASIEMVWRNAACRWKEIAFTDEEFAELFETLRKAAATYIRHYDFSEDQKTSILKVIFAP